MSQDKMQNVNTNYLLNFYVCSLHRNSTEAKIDVAVCLCVYLVRIRRYNANIREN